MIRRQAKPRSRNLSGASAPSFQEVSVQQTMPGEDTFWKYFGLDEAGNLFIRNTEAGDARNLWTYGGLIAGGVGESEHGAGALYSLSDIKKVVGQDAVADASGNPAVAGMILAFNGSKWYAKTESGGGGGDAVSWGAEGVGYVPLSVNGVAKNLSLNTHKHTWTDITNGKPTTLAEYGITDCRIDGGVITIGNSSITPVTSLADYYPKTDTYSKVEVNSLISSISQFVYESVAVLPAASASTMNKIYLVPSASAASQNVKDEYITIDNGASSQTRYTWERIGNTEIDLSNYYTKAQTDSAIANHHDSSKQNVINASNKLSATFVSGLAPVATLGTFSSLTGMPTTLAGYGITDAYDDGTIDAWMDLKQDVIDSYNKLSASYISGLATVATSGAYSSLSGRPSKLSDFADDVVSGHYLPLSGGVISGNTDIPLKLRNTSANHIGIYYRNKTDNAHMAAVEYTDTYYGMRLMCCDATEGNLKGMLGVDNDGMPYCIIDLTHTKYGLLHSGNFVAGVNYVAPSALNSYLPLSGGTVTGDLSLNGHLNMAKGKVLYLDTTSGKQTTITKGTDGMLYIENKEHDIYFIPKTGGSLWMQGTFHSSGNGYFDAECWFKDGLYPQLDNKAIGSAGHPWGSITVRRWYPNPSDTSVYAEYDTTLGALKIIGNLVVTGAVVAGQTNS